MSAALELWLHRLSRLVLLTSVAIVLATAAALFSPGLRNAIGLSTQTVAYRVGDRIDTPSSTYGGSPYTLLIFARSSCAACQDARGFISELIRSVEGTGALAFSLIMPLSSQAENVEYVRLLGLSKEHVFPADLGAFRLEVVPTAVFVNEQGIILGVSEGTGPPLQALMSLVFTTVQAHQ